MKALQCVQHGLPETLKLNDIAVPEPGKNQVRIKVHAAGVNFPDVLIIQNLYQFKPPLPFSPGGEAAGVVDAVGEGITDLKVGDRVIAMIGNGAMAEYLIANRPQVIPMADDMPFDVASGFTMTYGTSHHALKQRANLQPGETVLVLGASGGVTNVYVYVGAFAGPPNEGVSAARTTTAGMPSGSSSSSMPSPPSSSAPPSPPAAVAGLMPVVRPSIAAVRRNRFLIRASNSGSLIGHRLPIDHSRCASPTVSRMTKTMEAMIMFMSGKSGAPASRDASGRYPRRRRCRRYRRDQDR